MYFTINISKNKRRPHCLRWSVMRGIFEPTKSVGDGGQKKTEENPLKVVRFVLTDQKDEFILLFANIEITILTHIPTTSIYHNIRIIALTEIFN